jgi:hypothetical protein
VRRGTAITLIILFVVLVITTIVQLNQQAPPAPFPGPVSGTPLPTQLSPSPAA